MFFKKKVGKGVRGEGKNLQSVFIILFFFFPLAQGQSRKMGAVDFWGCRTRLPGFVCAGFAGSTWGCAPPGAATGPAAAPCLLLPKYRGHSVQPQAVQLCPRGGTETLGHPGTCSCHASQHLLGVFGVTGRGDAVGL